MFAMYKFKVTIVQPVKVFMFNVVSIQVQVLQKCTFLVQYFSECNSETVQTVEVFSV